ncbi:hypothetical protein VNO78_31323 [Psophocarpus tetragonolobus]|uniref:F-box/LRR-repeat protein 15-like leucin rich repeat domain-containing protein n=1 Tax=Psophocarpus tetragonolobus TaxID=3891 RepID=A0AAN9RYL6_PSOTE
MLEIMEKCLHHILQLKHLQDLVLEPCVGIESEGLTVLQASCKSMKSIGRIDIASLTNGAQNLEKLILSSSLINGACSIVSRKGFLLIGQCQLLEELDVTDTEIDDEGLWSISRCTKLSSLKLGMCLMITDNGLKHIANGCSKLKHLDLYRSSRITDDGIVAVALGYPLLEIKLSFCSVTEVRLIALASISCLHYISIFHVEGLSSNGLAAFLLACQNLTKVKLYACFESLIPQQILKYMEARGFVLVWREKMFEASVHLPFGRFSPLFSASGSRSKMMEATHWKEFVIEEVEVFTKTDEVVAASLVLSQHRRKELKEFIRDGNKKCKHKSQSKISIVGLSKTTNFKWI